jgi:hypothetical protein
MDIVRNVPHQQKGAMVSMTIRFAPSWTLEPGPLHAVRLISLDRAQA